MSVDEHPRLRPTERMLVDVRPHLRLTGRIVGGARRRTSETSFYGANNGDDSSLFSPYSSHNRSRYNSRTTEELDGSVRVRNPDGTSLRIKERSPGRWPDSPNWSRSYVSPGTRLHVEYLSSIDVLPRPGLREGAARPERPSGCVLAKLLGVSNPRLLWGRT